MSDALARDVVATWERLSGDRATWMTHWQDCADYIAPDRADYTLHRQPGVKRLAKLYDSTAIMANGQLAAGLHGLLTSPTLQWFHLRAQDDALNADPDCAAWLDSASDALYLLFNGPTHNFASQSNELYLDLGCVGTGVMAVLESDRVDVLFSTKALRECVIAENEEDRVDLLCRKFHFSARQAVMQWGAAAGDKVLKAVDATPDRKFEFLHMVRPRSARDPLRSDVKHKRFQSVYVSLEDGTVLSEGGYDEFPYLVPRFSKSTGEVYGRSPGMTALPDIKTLNEMVRQALMANQIKLQPPIQYPDDGFLFPLNFTPGGRNPYRAGMRDRAEPIQMGIDVQVGIETVSRLQTQVNRAFYTEWLMMPSDPADPAAAGKGVTATYTLQQRDEKMRLLSPMLARMQSEFLGPLIDRTFSIAYRRSKARRFGQGSILPPPPPRISGAALRVEYVSPIAIAQKSSQLDSISRLVQTALLLAQVDPETPKILDAEQILRITGRDLATPATALKSQQQVAAEAQQAAQAQAAQQNADALAKVGGAAKNISQSVGNLIDAGGAVGGNQAVTGQAQAA